MTMRMVYSFVLFKGKLSLPKSSVAPICKSLGQTWKAFAVTSSRSIYFIYGIQIFKGLVEWSCSGKQQ